MKDGRTTPEKGAVPVFSAHSAFLKKSRIRGWKEIRNDKGNSNPGSKAKPEKSEVGVTVEA